MNCRACGRPALADASYCSSCGAALLSPARSPDHLSTLIPYRNLPALVGYYLAVFSLIPVFGLVLTLPALILGVVGVVRATRHPEGKGKAHAWVAVCLGLASPILQTVGFFLLVKLA